MTGAAGEVDKALDRLRGHRPWSNKQLRRLGDAIRAASDPPDGCPTYGTVLEWYDDLAVSVQTIITSLDWEPLLHGALPSVTSRAKTIGTLRDKLLRMPEYPLQSIQDVAGIRFEAEMSLAQQDTVVGTLVGVLGQEPSCVADLRTDPHSGYRAVHLRLVFPAGRAELQVRTHLQGEWANMYESLGDLLGRSIRYGDMPDDDQWRGVVSDLQRRSTVRASRIEQLRNDLQVARLAGSDPALLDELEREERALEEDYTREMKALERTFREMRA